MFSDDTDSGGTRGEVIGGAAQIGVWSHLVAGYDATSHQVSLYVNGVLVGTAPFTMPRNTAGGLQIGRAKMSGSLVEYFPGAIDDVNVYTRLLFAEEIQAMAGRDLSLAHNWPLDEPSGTNAADAVGTRVGTLSGATHVPGKLGNALSFNGVDNTVSTAGVDIDTSASFTVATWVKLRRTCDLGGNLNCKLTAVSLDGGQTSKFRLGHLVDSNENLFGAWQFEMPAADGSVAKAAVSAIESDMNTWVHLVGVYDAPAHQIWLYVNATRQGDGTLNTPWTATGGLKLGRGRVNNVAAEFWPGEVDDVRMYVGALDKSRIANLYSAYPAAGGPASMPVADNGSWQFSEAAGATTSADASGRGRPVTLAGGAALTGWYLKLDGTSAYAQTTGPVVNTSQSFSVSAWTYTDRPVTANKTLFGQDGNRMSTFQVQLRADTGKWVVIVPNADADNASGIVLASSQPASIGDWQHVALTYDATLRQLRLYVNGILSAAQVGVTIQPAGGPFAIGRSKTNGAKADFFLDAVDDVRVFGKALSDDEARVVHDDRAAANHGYYRFNDGTGSDSQWRHNDATLSGGTSFTSGVDGQAVQFDGSTGSASTVWSGVSMRDSFTVSAWVQLTAKNNEYTVLGQEGTRMSGFQLQYRRNGNRWTFGGPTEDSDSAPLAYVSSAQPAALNQWTHLTGVYDYPQRQLRLYVNGVLSGMKKDVTLWAAGGPMTIGRGKVNGKPANFLAGAVDEVITDKWVVAEDEIARRGSYPTPPPWQMGRFVNAAGDHYTANTGLPVPDGYHLEATLGTPAPAGPNTKMLYACMFGKDAFTSPDAACENNVKVGEIGLVYTVQPTNIPTVAVYRCNTGPDHFDAVNCGSAPQDGLLGYAVAYAQLPRYYNTVAPDHLSTTSGAPPGYRFEGGSYRLPMIAQPGTQPLTNCRDGQDFFVSLSTTCDGKQVIGEIGQIWTAPPAGPGLTSAPVYQCAFPDSGQRMVSYRADCEGLTVVGRLGYALTDLPGTAPVFP
jgi:hypothetical protein